MWVSYAWNIVTITWSHKTWTTWTSAVNTIVRSTWDVFAAWDIWRLIAIVPSVVNSWNTQVREIIAVSWNTATVHDDWVWWAPASSTNWKIAHNCEDVHLISDPALEKIGNSSYRWDADWNITSSWFFWDLDISLEMRTNTLVAWNISDWSIAQFGILWWWEAWTSTETTKWCRIFFESTRAWTQNIYSLTNSRVANWAITNYYWCLIESTSTSSWNWMFQRMRWPTRFIWCIFDWNMWGRFYHEFSELADWRMSWNNTSVTSWSLWATFTREINNIKFFRNTWAIKNYLTFSWTFKDCILEDSNWDIFLVNWNVWSIVDFVDCTTWADSKLLDWGSWIINQKKSINYTTTDTSWTNLSAVKVRIEDKNWLQQDSIETSDVSWIVPEILTTFWKWTNNSPAVEFFPFTFRIRKYDYQFQQFDSPVDDKIKQWLRIPDNTVTVLSEASAIALTWISIDFWTNTINITTNKTTSEIYDFIQASLVLDANMDEDEFFTSTDWVTFVPWYDISVTSATISWSWDTLSMWSNTIFLHSSSGCTAKIFSWITSLDTAWSYTSLVLDSTTIDLTSVWTYTLNSSTFTWTVHIDSSNNSTVTVTIPTWTSFVNDNPAFVTVVSSTWIAVTNPNFINWTRVRLYNVTQAAEIDNSLVSWWGWYSYGATVWSWEEIEVWDTIKMTSIYNSGTTYKNETDESLLWQTSNMTYLATQSDNTVLNWYALDGSAQTDFTADYPSIEVDINSWDTTRQKLLSWIAYIETTEDWIRNFFWAITNEDSWNSKINTSIVDLKIDYTWTWNSRFTDELRLYRDDWSSIFWWAWDNFYANSWKVFLVESWTSWLTPSESAKLLAIPTADDNADAVWDEDIVLAHTTVDSAWERLITTKDWAKKAWSQRLN